MHIHARSVGEISAFRDVTRDEAVKIFRPISGRTCTVEISADKTAKELVEACFALFKIDPSVHIDEMKLMQGDDLLMQHGTLRDLDLKNGDSVCIHLVVVVR
jgi:hypothetical protein